MRFHMLHPRDQWVAITKRIYHNGMTTLSGGNLSIRDEDDNIWITPAGVDKGNLTLKDIISVQPDGTKLGPHSPSSELPFHRAICTRRPDLRARRPRPHARAGFLQYHVPIGEAEIVDLKKAFHLVEEEG